MICLKKPTLRGFFYIFNAILNFFVLKSVLCSPEFKRAGANFDLGMSLGIKKLRMMLFMNLSQLQQKLNSIWYQNQSSWLNLILIPLSVVFKFVLVARQFFVSPPCHANSLPVIVVGNLTVGGNGKTPAILALIAFAQKQGKKPAVICRGYPVNPARPLLVNDQSSADTVGDEALLIFKRTGVPVSVCRDRRAAILALAGQDIDLIFSDDGLQNFHFKHDLELVIYDAVRQFGNKKLLPAGPLREPITRLARVDFILRKEFAAAPVDQVSQLQGRRVYSFQLSYSYFVALPDWARQNNAKKITADYFKNKKVMAVTAIANPESFFTILRMQGIEFEPIAFNDHYALSARDFVLFKDCEVIMTEKDAVKSLDFADQHFWCLPLIGVFSNEFEQAFAPALLKLS
jgi:tetraacyldisaccharide 4'-kinase